MSCTIWGSEYETLTEHERAADLVLRGINTLVRLRRVPAHALPRNDISRSPDIGLGKRWLTAV